MSITIEKRINKRSKEWMPNNKAKNFGAPIICIFVIFTTTNKITDSFSILYKIEFSRRIVLLIKNNLFGSTRSLFGFYIYDFFARDCPFEKLHKTYPFFFNVPF